MSTEELLHRAQALLIEERALRPEELTELARQIRRSPPESPELARQLHSVLLALSEQVRSDLKATGAALRRVSKGRKALRGYGGTRSARRAQRANRVA